MSISFKVKPEERELIQLIAQRARAMFLEAGVPADLVEIKMDLTATHANGCPLDFQKLMNFDAANFGHDVGGIRKYLDRDTGKLTSCFVPRCARPEGGKS